MVTRNIALVVVIFGGVCAWCTATPVCTVGREYVVDNCVRYRCIFGRATPDPCPSGLFPSYKVGTGCSWPRESECTTDLETGKSKRTFTVTAEIFILIKIFKMIPGNLIYVCWISQSLIRAVGILVWMEVDALLPPMANPTSVPVPPATRELVVKSVRKFQRFTAFLRKVHYNNTLYNVKYINILFQKMKTSAWVAPARMGEFVWTNRTASGASVLWELAGSTSQDHSVKPKHQNVSQLHKIERIYCERHSHVHVFSLLMLT